MLHKRWHYESNAQTAAPERRRQIVPQVVHAVSFGGLKLPGAGAHHAGGARENG